MNENIDLTKILINCEGTELYSILHGKVTLSHLDINSEYPITYRCINSSGFTDAECLTKEGKTNKFFDGECVIFPSKEQRDWSKFVKPIKKGTPMMCNQSPCSGYKWVLQYYIGFYKGNRCEHKHHMVSSDNCISKDDYYNYVIPFDKFNPNDIEGSLKYNIQK